MDIPGTLAAVGIGLGVFGMLSSWVTRFVNARLEAAGMVADALNRHTRVLEEGFGKHTRMLEDHFGRLEAQRRKIEHAEAMRPRVTDDVNLAYAPAELVAKLGTRRP